MKTLKPVPKSLIFLLLLAMNSVRAVQGQPQVEQNRDSRLVTHPAIVKSLPGPNKRWALLIGVDRYEDSNIASLRGADNDANSLKETLINYAGFPEDQVVVLATNQVPERQPTRKNILKSLSNLAGLVPKDGLLLVSFAGHGIERSGHAFLIPSDATLTEDISLLEETAVSVIYLKRRIKDTGVQQVMLLLDACRTYPTGRSNSSNPLTQAFANAFNFDTRNREVVAFAVLYATAIGYRAYEYGAKKQGYFSWAIGQALSGAAANDRGEVTLHSLVKYLEEKVPNLVALDYGPKVIQKPFAEIEGYRADELVLTVSSPLALKRPSSSVNGSQSAPIIETNEPQPVTVKKRGAKSGNVAVVMILLKGTSQNEESIHVLGNEFSLPLTAALSGLRRVNVLVENPRDVAKVISSLRKNGEDALIVKATLSLNDLAPFNELNVSEANGGLELIDSDNGRVIGVENILRVRGFGNSQDQARRNALKNSAEGVSKQFIKQVITEAN